MCCANLLGLSCPYEITSKDAPIHFVIVDFSSEEILKHTECI